MPLHVLLGLSLSAAAEQPLTAAGHAKLAMKRVRPFQNAKANGKRPLPSLNWTGVALKADEVPATIIEGARKNRRSNGRWAKTNGGALSHESKNGNTENRKQQLRVDGVNAYVTTWRGNTSSGAFDGLKVLLHSIREFDRERQIVVLTRCGVVGRISSNNTSKTNGCATVETWHQIYM